MPLKAQIMMGPLEKYKHYSMILKLTYSRPISMETLDPFNSYHAFFSLSYHDHGIYWRLFEKSGNTMAPYIPRPKGNYFIFCIFSLNIDLFFR